MTDHPAGTSIHGTSVALGGSAALLRGGSGSGKSDLALRFLHLANNRDFDAEHRLVSDDRVYVSRKGRGLTITAPKTITGLMEVRGVGVVPCDYIASADLVVLVDLVAREDVPRMQYPLETDSYTDIEGVTLPCIKLYPFEASAPLKLKIWLEMLTKES